MKKSVPKQAMQSRCVNMSNALIRSAHSLTLAEKRLVMLAVSKLDSTKESPMPADMTVKITAAEFVEAFGVSPNTAYEEMLSASKQLFLRYIRFFTDTPTGEIERTMHWVGDAAYKRGEGWIELALYYKLAPQLFELKKQFTSYKLSRAAALRSIYSWRLFELLMQFKSTGLLRIQIDEFCHAVEAPESYTTDFFNLRQRVIEPSIKEIAEKDGLQVAWEPIKAGRKVKALEFRFNPQSQVAMGLEVKKPAKPKKAAKPAAKAEAKPVVPSSKKEAAARVNSLKDILKGKKSG